VAPREEKTEKVLQPPQEEKRPKRFRLIRLEERIAPSGGGGNSGHGGCDPWLNFTAHNCGKWA
jgi:hypothetical protein